MKNAYPQLKATTLAVAVAALFAQPLIQAQENNDKKLQAVEVVGTSPLPGLGIEKNKLPYDVQSYGGEDIHNSQSINIPEYMSRNLTGVNINEFQGSPFQADITYRGFRLSGLLGTSQGLSVYLDGVRVNEPFGDVVNWDMIPEAAISHISLIPGSNPVYGLNTLGGALAFTTKSGLTAPGTDLKLSLGSFMRKRADVTYGEKSQDGTHRFIAATAFHEDGWRDYSSGQLGNVFAKVGKTQADVNWDVSLLHGQSNLLGNGLLPSHGYEDGAKVPGMYQINRRWVYTHQDRTKNQLTMLNFNLQRLLDGDTQLATNAYVRSSNRNSVNGDAGFEDGAIDAVMNYTATRQTGYGTSVNVTRIIDTHQLTTGASYDGSQMKYGASQGDCDGNISASRAPFDCEAAIDDVKVRGRSNTFGIFATDTWTIAPDTYLTTGARFNHSRVSNTITNYEAGVGTARPRESFTYNSLNPSIGLSKKIDERLDVFGNLSQSNRVPTPIELGCADPAEPCRLPIGMQADPFLKQVIGRTVEGGVRWKLSDQSGVTASLYRTENKNDIIFMAADQTGLGYFDNFSKTRRQGIDLTGYTSVHQVALRFSYSYLNATYQADGELWGGEREIDIKKGARIAGLPEHTLKLMADWRVQPKLVVGGTAIATSSLVTQNNEDGLVGNEDSAESVNAKVKGYFLLNLHANFEAQKGLDYFARIHNVFDRRFETYGLMAESMFTAQGQVASGSTVSRFVAPGAPRSFLVGVRYRF
jgi:outer membrane receptor protein involved in Fe transport